MIRRPPRSTQSRSSAASDVYKRQGHVTVGDLVEVPVLLALLVAAAMLPYVLTVLTLLSLIHISEPTRLLSISYAVFCLKKKNS